MCWIAIVVCVRVWKGLAEFVVVLKRCQLRHTTEFLP